MSLERIARLGMALAILTTPTALAAQSTGSIAGLVTDMTGAVLPGVTVETSSPALIERSRTAVTDAQGRYEIVALPTGTYGVTFTLAGFASTKRENITLPTGFTATVNAQLTVGAVAETVTISGASPIIDVQNAHTQKVLTREILDVLPTNNSMQGFASLIPGMRADTLYGGPYDVGGNLTDTYGGISQYGLRSGDAKSMMNGMSFNSMVGGNGGSDKQYFVNQADVQEVVLESAGIGAEQETGGIHINFIPKSGSNTFSSYFNTAGTAGALQSDNLTDAIVARGATQAKETKKIYDLGGSFGGPIIKDRLWFQTSHRWWGSQAWALVYYNQTQHTPVYTPDYSRRGHTDYYNIDDTGRLTWQASTKHKLTFSESKEHNCNCNLRVDLPGYAPEANIDYTYFGINLLQGTWTYPATNRLLLEAGATALYNHTVDRLAREVAPTDIAIVETTTNFNYNAPSLGIGAAAAGDDFDTSQQNQHFSASYITGSHAFKAGFSTLQGINHVGEAYINQALVYSFRNGAPLSITQYASPHSQTNRLKLNLGLFAQDKWTVSRLTLNLGLRFDYFNAYVPAQIRPAGRFVPEVVVPRVDNAVNQTDLNPRLGAAYDLFGDGKTAARFSIGRYVASQGASSAGPRNSAQQVVLSTNRTWNDANRNFIPDCDLTDRTSNGECGAIDNAAFGTVRPATQYANDVLTGFGNRPYNWSLSLGVQRELRPNVSVNAAYYRTWFGNFISTDNLSVTPADYNPYCITAPVDSRLSGGGGYQICDVGDITPSKFGQVNNIVVKSSNFGDRREVYDGIDLTTNARFGRNGRGLLQGGLNTGRTFTQCVVVDAPVQFCKVEPPFWLPQWKLSGSYPLPWNFTTAVVFNNIPGIPLSVGGVGATSTTYVATNAQIAPSLGRNLAACGATVVGCNATAVVQLLNPYRNYERRANQLDLRFTRSFSVKKGRVLAIVDLYNVANAIDVGAQTLRYGSSYQVPSDLKGGRLLKFGAQANF